MANISLLRAVLMPDAAECQLFAVVYWPYNTNFIIYNKNYALKMLCFPLNTGIAVICQFFFQRYQLLDTNKLLGKPLS